MKRYFSSANKQYAIFYLMSFFILLRMINLLAPILGAQSWRQADTAAITRNFFENGYNLFYPQVDWGGNTAGFVESEFPVYQFVIALFYKIFGIHEFIGRLISIGFSAISLLLFYKIVLILINQKTAMWSAFIYSILPLNIFYSRVFMPEPLLIMSILSGIYFFIRWTESSRISHFSLSLIFISIACLIKIPTLYIGLPLAFLSYKKYGWKAIKKPLLLFYSGFILISLFLWYSHAHQIFIDTGLSFGIWGYGSDKWGNWDFIFTWEFINGVFFKNIAEKHLTWIGFIFCSIGLIKFYKDKMYGFFYSWIAAGFIYLIIVAKGNYFHDYYQLPITIPLTVFIGSTFSEYFSTSTFSIHRKTLLYGSLALLFVLSGARVADYFSREDLSKNEKYMLALKSNEIVEPNSLVIAVSNYDPMLLYNAHKKGWQCFPSELTNDFILEKKKLGAKYILANINDLSTNDLNRIFSSGCETIYRDKTSIIISLFSHQ